MDNICVVFNPTAGRRRRRLLRRVLAGLTERQIPFHVEETRAAGDARRIAADLPQSVDAVVVAGGDGTINEVLNGLVARAAKGDRVPELALVPLGTANVLAAEIGLAELSPGNIADTIIGGRRRRFYPACVNNRHFVSMCGVGFDAHVVATVNLRLKRRAGKLAYVVAALAQAWRYVPRSYRISIDGNAYLAASVIVANGHFYAGRYVCAPQARIDEPLLYACLFRGSGRWNVIRYAWGLIRGRLSQFSDVMIVPAQRVTIESAGSAKRGEPVQGDGDIIAFLPATIAAGVTPLTVRCPV